MPTDNELVDFASAMSAFEGKHFATAMGMLSPFAEKGNQEAQHRMAMMYREGNGVEKDLDEAKKWYDMAGFTDMELE